MHVLVVPVLLNMCVFCYQHYQQNDWLINLVAKLLVNDELATSLIAHNPFEGREPPK